jgi:DNA-binding NarL/FixJ family response regulator
MQSECPERHFCKAGFDARFAFPKDAKKGREHGLVLILAHSASQSNRVGENVNVTNESRIVLCKPLNTTEIEVLQHLADGLGTADIAASRSTTAQVIKNYTYRACQKLGADNRAHLIAVAFRAGIIK